MAAPVNARGGLSWVILVVALAIPGVLFYNWWSHLKADREKTVAAKARGRVPDGGVFQSSPNAKLVNPMTPDASAGAVAAAPAAVSTQPAIVLAAPAQAAPAVAAPEPAAGVQPLVAEAAAAAPAPAVAPASTSTLQTVPSVIFSSVTAASVPLRRDPTLSPYDQLKIIEEQEAKEKAARDLEDMKRVRAESKRPKKLKDPASTIEVQGIISNPDSGFKAIVNNEVVGVGELVGKIKVVKITDMGVTFEYLGKRFKKGVSQ